MAHQKVAERYVEVGVIGRELDRAAVRRLSLSEPFLIPEEIPQGSVEVWVIRRKIGGPALGSLALRESLLTS